MGVVGRANGLTGWVGCIEIPLLYDGAVPIGEDKFSMSMDYVV